MSRARDCQTLDLLAVPSPAPALPSSMDYRHEVAELVSATLKAADGDRYDIAARMSRLSGHEVSKYMLDAWSSTARDAYNVPFYQAPVIEAACDTYLFSNWLAAKRGGRLLVGKETLMAELGKLERMKADIAQKTRELKKIMGEME